MKNLYCRILNNETGLVQIGAGCPDSYYIEIGMEKRNVEQSEKDYQWYLTEKCPHYTPAEKEQMERERIANLNLTKADFWIALLDKSITKQMVKDKINLIQDEILKAKTLIRIDEADHFWRGDASIDIIGAMFGITPEELTYLFEHKQFPEEE